MNRTHDLIILFFFTILVQSVTYFEKESTAFQFRTLTWDQEGDTRGCVLYVYIIRFYPCSADIVIAELHCFSHELPLQCGYMAVFCDYMALFFE